MSLLIFPDNTVLVNFALMGRVELLESLVRGRAAWTMTISGECHRSAQEVGLEALLRMPEVFGEPLLPTPAERRDAQLYRERIAGKDLRPNASLGEAEALAIINRRHIEGAVFVSDDAGAREIAPRLGIVVYSTLDLLGLARRTNLIDTGDMWSCIEILRSKGRRIGPAPATFESFTEWVRR